MVGSEVGEAPLDERAIYGGPKRVIHVWKGSAEGGDQRSRTFVIPLTWSHRWDVCGVVAHGLGVGGKEKLGHPTTEGYEEKEPNGALNVNGVLCFNGLGSVVRIFTQFIAPRPSYPTSRISLPMPKGAPPGVSERRNMSGFRSKHPIARASGPRRDERMQKPKLPRVHQNEGADKR